MHPALRNIVLGGRPALDIDFSAGTADPRIAYTGGANGTRFNADGFIEAKAAPRIDYDPVTLAIRGLLIEEERTNFIVRSSEFDNVAWLKTNGTISPDAATGPDGTTSADKLVEGATSTYWRTMSGNVAIAGAIVQSDYTKAAGRSWMLLNDDINGKGAFFDLANNVAGGVDAGVTASVVPARNGWARRVIALNSGANSKLAQYVASGDGTVSYQGNGTSGIYLYGAQLEAGGFATSYIPTVAVQVTRTADAAVISGVSFAQRWNPSQGSVAVTFDVNVTTGTRPIVSLDDGTANNQILLYVSAGSLKLTVTAGGVQQADLTLGSTTAGTQYKAAFSYATNAFGALVSGGTFQSASPATLPAVTQMRIGSDQAGNYQNGHNLRTRVWRYSKSLWSLV